MARLQHVLLRHRQHSTSSILTEIRGAPGCGPQKTLIRATILSIVPMMMLTLRNE